jgi:hypothetical protein
VFRIEAYSASAELTIESASLDTGNAKRDDHLRSVDFFHTDQHAAVTFTSQAITRHGRMDAPAGRHVNEDDRRAFERAVLPDERSQRRPLVGGGAMLSTGVLGGRDTVVLAVIPIGLGVISTVATLAVPVVLRRTPQRTWPTWLLDLAAGIDGARHALRRPHWRLFGAIGYLGFDIAALGAAIVATGRSSSWTVHGEVREQADHVMAPSVGGG